MIRKGKEKACAAGDPDKRRTERTPRKCFRCGYEDHIIAKFPKQIKDNDKRRKQVRFNERVNRVLQKEYYKGKIILTKRYMHIWRVCLIMTNFLVGILMTVRNRPILF